ncbi:MAG: ferritin family protein, partial [Thermodesulfobacteriota bacterium]|nr:ferritin family protein [Thermodesulfobacteriota bacterium]
ILEGLKTAMEAELTGHNFYKNAAKNMDDDRAKAALSEMAEEEMAHFNYLRHQYKSILETSHYDFTKELIKDSRGKEENPIFSEVIKSRVKDCHYEVSVLTIGMKLELDAIHYYQACAKKAESEEAKLFYRNLARWEQRHYDAFDQALNALKEEYWEANNFVPMI